MATPVPIRASILSVLAVLTVACALALPAHAGASGGRLDAALDLIINDPEGPPGLTVVIHHGRHTEFRSRGVADLETGAKPKIDSPMRIASMAKAFNGAIALSLASERRL